MTENNDQSNEPTVQANESQPLDLPLESQQPKPRITEELKKLLSSLCKNSLERRIRRLERRNDDEAKDIKFIDKNFKNLKLQLHSLVKNVEETKKKEAKKKEASPRKLKVKLAKHPLASKSVPPRKKDKN